MEYISLAIITAALVLLIYIGKKKKYSEKESKIQSLKRSVLLTILVNSLIYTPFILFKTKWTIFNVVFFWIINFVIPYLGFEKLFKEND